MITCMHIMIRTGEHKKPNWNWNLGKKPVWIPDNKQLKLTLVHFSRDTIFQKGMDQQDS